MAINLRAKLLPFTLRNAARLAAYRDLWVDVDVERLTYYDLPALPMMTKAVYRQTLMREPSIARETAYLTHSTGTTGGITWRARSRAEVEFMGRFLRARTASDANGFVLAFRSSTHGMALPIPSNGMSMPIQLLDDDDVGPCVELLAAELPLGRHRRRATAVAGDIVNVALLGELIAERDIATQIGRLATGGPVDVGQGSLLTKRYPGALVRNRFSLSEIVGGASRCLPEQAFRIDPHIIAEVVDDEGSPLPAQSVGELVLTELFPFVQLQPLVRYATGDLVRRVEDAEGDLRFEWLGRISQSARDEATGACLLGHQQVADVLARQPLVARRVPRPGFTQLRGLDVGPPVFELDADSSGMMNLTVGLRLDPGENRSAVERFVTDLWRGLSDVCLVPGRRVQLHLHDGRPTRAPARTAPTVTLRSTPLGAQPPRWPPSLDVAIH